MFEAWYFQKVREEQDRRKAEEEAKEAARLKQLEEEAEKKEKSEVEFQQWLSDKKAAYKKMLRYQIYCSLAKPLRVQYNL